MNNHQLKRLFPNASVSTLAANAGDYGSGQPIPEPQTPAGEPAAPKIRRTAIHACNAMPPPRPRRARGPNKTEARYMALLEAEKQEAAISNYRYEGIRLKWGGDMHYTPDFIVFRDRITLIEVKGAHIYDRDLVRFKGCRAEWPQFNFEMWQWKGGAWKRLH